MPDNTVYRELQKRLIYFPERLNLNDSTSTSQKDKPG